MNQREMELVIKDLVLQAQANPGVPQRFTLDGGLRLDVLMHHGLTQLQLSREDEFPTIEDYRFALRSWPFEVDWPEPKAVAHSGRKFLTGDWLKPTHPISNPVIS
jgi:hypothetical protein